MATALNLQVQMVGTVSLSLGDVMCPVCRGIFIEPVTLPCRHGLCLKCFERAMDESSLSCPLCRRRVGSWLRAATKGGGVINTGLWACIQARWPDQVRRKMSGQDDGVSDQVVTASTPTVRLSRQGEIRREYELQLQKFEEEVERKRQEERRASEALIRKIREEEEQLLEKELQDRRLRLVTQARDDEQVARRLQEQEEEARREQEREDEQRRQRLLQQTQEDEELARRLQGSETQISSTTPMPSVAGAKWTAADKENQKRDVCAHAHPHTPVGSKGLLDVYVKKTKLLGTLNSNRGEPPRAISSVSSDSHDSIDQELHHFKPIKAVPRTPPKRMPDGQVIEPQLIRSTPLNLNSVYDAMRTTPVCHISLRPVKLRTGVPPTVRTCPAALGSTQDSAFSASGGEHHVAFTGLDTIAKGEGGRMDVEDLQQAYYRQREEDLLKADLELAHKLQEEWDREASRIDRSKNSANPYCLRNGSCPRKSPSGPSSGGKRPRERGKTMAKKRRKKSMAGKAANSGMLLRKRSQKTLEESFAAGH